MSARDVIVRTSPCVGSRPASNARCKWIGGYAQELENVNALAHLSPPDKRGRYPHLDQVRSSIACRLRMNIGAMTAADRNVEGVLEMMLDANWTDSQPLPAP